MIYQKKKEPDEFDKIIGDPDLYGLPQREKLEAFFAKYNPSKVSTIDTILSKYEGNERRRRMWQLLRKKYKDEIEESLPPPSYSMH